jgi:hypothetical protein
MEDLRMASSVVEPMDDPIDALFWIEVQPRPKAHPGEASFPTPMPLPVVAKGTLGVLYIHPVSRDKVWFAWSDENKTWTCIDKGARGLDDDA